jgi:hypothetical protein
MASCCKPTGSRRAWSVVRRRALAQGGFAVPTVLFMILAAFAVASAAVGSSIEAQRGTSRDLNTKDALAVAEAGTHQALVRYNSLAASTCVAPQTMSGGWCTAATGTLPGGGAFTYRVKLGPGVIDIVSQGTKDGVTRRLKTTAHSAAGQQWFTDAGVVGLNSITVANNSSIVADAATNGNITLDGTSTLCGDAQVGTGFDVLPAGTTRHTCGAELRGTVTLPSVNQGDVRTVNNNSNFFAKTEISGPKERACFNGFNGLGQASADCGSRELVITGGGTSGGTALTLPSGNYSLCKLRLISNSRLYVASGASVRIYFDSPEACGYGPRVAQLQLDSNSIITATGTATAADLALLFVGSETIPTSILLASNSDAQAVCAQDFVIYAPRTDLTMASNSYYCGAMAAKTIDVATNSNVRTSNQAQDFVLPNSPPHYVVDNFVECAGPTPSSASPDSGC